MSSYNAPFEIHVHGQVPLRADTSFEQLQDALKPLWKYAGARSLADGAASAYEEEPGITFDAQEHLLQMCWTVRGDEDFRQSLDEMCMSLNELAEQGAAIEVTSTTPTSTKRRKRKGPSPVMTSSCCLWVLRRPPSCRRSAICWCRTWST